GGGICRHPGLHDGGTGSREVSQRRQCTTHRTRLHHSGPAHDERDAVAAFPGIALHSAVVTGCAVMETFGKLRPPVWAIVTGENDQCMLCNAETVDCP